MTEELKEITPKAPDALEEATTTGKFTAEGFQKQVYRWAVHKVKMEMQETWKPKNAKVKKLRAIAKASRQRNRKSGKGR